MTAGEKCEVYKKVWVDVAPHERTVWKCLDKPAKKAKKKAKKPKPAKEPKPAKKSKPAKKAKKAKGKAKAPKVTLTVRMPSWFKKKGAPVEVKSFPVKKGPIKYAEDYKLKEP